MKSLVLKILSMMNEVVDEVVVLECLESILDVLIREVEKEEILLRPPGEGDAGQDVRWVNHFGEVDLSLNVRQCPFVGTSAPGRYE